MYDKNDKFFVLKFSRMFVNSVYNILFSWTEKGPGSNGLSNALMKPLQVFLDCHKMELYFLYREELASFEKKLNEASFKELLESMTSDLKADGYETRDFSYFCIILSYFAAITSRNNIPKALQVAARIIIDAIEYFGKDDAIKFDIIEGVQSSLIETARRIVARNKSLRAKLGSDDLKKELQYYNSLLETYTEF